MMGSFECNEEIDLVYLGFLWHSCSVLCCAEAPKPGGFGGREP